MKKSEYNYFAFFDVDETIIYKKSMFSFIKFYALSRLKKFDFITLFKYFYLIFIIKILSKTKTPRENINKIYYKFYKNYNFSSLQEYGEKWFQFLTSTENAFNDAIVNEINLHKSKGAAIVFVSGSFYPCLKPIAKFLMADFIICTKLEVISDKCSGKLIGKPVIGEEKSIKVQELLKEYNYFNYNLCFCYGDHISDLPMLKLIGHPRVVSNCDKLISYAKNHNWIVI